MTTPAQPDPMGGSIAGAADLQASIDRLDNAMQSLTTAIQGSNNGSGMATAPAMAPSFAAAGVQFSGGTYAGAGGGSGPGTYMATGAYTGGNNGSGGTGGTNPYSFGGLFGGGGGFNPLQAIVNAGTSVINGQFASGTAQLNNQATINTYGYTQAGFWNVSSASAISTAFGGGHGGGLYMNNMATSASDARYGGTLLSQISGQANYTAAAGPVYGRGNSPFQLAATTAMANPGLGMANAASISGAFYNPSTSYNLMMMGIANTPLQLGTGRAQNMAGVEAAIGQRFGFQGFNSSNGTFNSQNLAANLNNPLFQMQIMDATGMSQQQYNVWSQQWAQMNNWAQAGHTTMNQMQNEVSQYMNGTAAQQGAAQSWLGAHGVSQSLLQSMTQANAAQTGAEAGGNVGFTKGLQDATTAINKLTAVLSGGLQNMAGLAGFAGATGSLNSSGVIGAGAGGMSNTIVNAIASGTNLLSDIASLAGINLSGYSGSGGGSGGGGGATGSSASMPSWAKQMASQFGWGSASDLAALNTVEMNEAGWNSTIFNQQGSGAFGIAQALGHGMNGTGGTYTNQYGGFGLSDAQARQANSGNAQMQFKWMLNYIKSIYGNPSNLLSMYESRSPHWYADGTNSARPGLALVGERGPELVALSGGQQIINSSQTARMMQPKFGGGGESSGGGLVIMFQQGAISIVNSGGGATGGYHTSADVQASAGQLVQAVETALKKSAVLQNIAAGVTG